MGYDFNDEGNGRQKPRSRRRGQGGGGEERLTVRPARNVKEIPPPSWDSPGSPQKSGWSHSEQHGRKSTLELDPSLRNGGRKGMSKTKRRIITMIIAECFALLFISGYGYWARTWNRMQKMDDWIPEEIQNQNFSIDLPQYEKQKGHWGIYIFGVDSRGSNVGKDTHSDVNIVCDINHDTGEIRLVSVFRDSYLNINDKNEYNKINQAYFRGGPAEAAKALNKNLDLNILDYVTFNWKAVADGINLLGGVDMEISRAEFAYINSFITETVKATGVYSEHLKGPGMQHLDGVQAVAYGRLRLMDTDYARTERQRKVIQAAFEKAKKADINTLNQLALLIFPQVATSVDLADILQLLGNVGNYHIGETGGFPFARGDANMGRKGACVIPQTLESNVVELHEFLYGQEGYTPSDTVKTISTRISSDTGMYSQGVSIDHVSTLGGSVPRPAKQQEKEKTTKAADRTEEDDGQGGEDEENSQEETGEDGEIVRRPEEDEIDEAQPLETSEAGQKRPTSTLYPDELGTQQRSTEPTASSRPAPTSPVHPGGSQGGSALDIPSPDSANSPTQSSRHPGSADPTGNSMAAENHPTAGSQPSAGNQPTAGNSSAEGNRPTAGNSSAEGNRPTAGNQPTTGNHPTAGNQPSAGNQPTTGNQPTAGNSPTAGNQSAAGNQPTAGNQPPAGNSSAPGSQTEPGGSAPTQNHPSGSVSQPGQNTPDVPPPTSSNGPTSVIVPDGQVISYDGPPGAGN